MLLRSLFSACDRCNYVVQLKGPKKSAPLIVAGAPLEKKLDFSSVCVSFFSNGPKIKPCAYVLMSSHLISGSQFELNSMRLAEFIIAQYHASSSVSLIASLKFFTFPHLTSTIDCTQNLPEHCYKSHSCSKYPKVVAFIQMNEYLVIRKFDSLAMIEDCSSHTRCPSQGKEDAHVQYRMIGLIIALLHTIKCLST